MLKCLLYTKTFINDTFGSCCNTNNKILYRKGCIIKRVVSCSYYTNRNCKFVTSHVFLVASLYVNVLPM